MTKDSEFFAKLESRFDKWLADFEQAPISMGIKIIFVVLVLRFVWRSFR